jgi:hypothetical protein
MMLFKQYHVPMIRAGAKDESRRMWGDKPRVKEGSYQQVKTKIFTKDHYGYIKIGRVYQEHLLDITEEGARREGEYTREEYIRLFHEIYPDAGDNPLLWVVEFVYSGHKMVK